MTYHEFLGALAAMLEVCSFLPYFWGIYKGRTKPHIFTWLLWGLISCIVFTAQLLEGAGAGAWLTGVNGIACLVVMLCAFRQKERHVDHVDVVLLVLALMAIPIWLMTHTPLWSVVLLCAINLLSFLPTIRKSWHRPWSETLQMYLMGVFSWGLSIAALERFSVVTLLFPVCVLASNILFVMMLFTRRRVVNK
jgi:hypothetical protein